MSVNLMTMVFRCNVPELKTDKGKTVPDSTAKFVLLALADHANDEGEGAYPSIKTICKKTNLSTATVVNALNALRFNGFTELMGRSKRETFNYTILVAKIAAFQWIESSDSTGQNNSVLATEIKPSSNHPPKPSIKQEGASAKQKATDFPELVLYRSVVNHFPKTFQREIVIKAIQNIGTRLNRGVTAEDLIPYWEAWGKVSGNEWSLVWLEWAESGRVPNGKQPPSEPKGVSVVRNWFAKKQAELSNG